MRVIVAICLFLSLLLFVGVARAQFSQPPPTGTPAPTCSSLKSASFFLFEGSDCRVKFLPVLPENAHTMLDCAVFAGMAVCVTSTDIYDNAGWTTLDPSTLTHYWAYSINGQEYYLPASYSDQQYIACDGAVVGYARVTAAGSTAQTAFDCRMPFPEQPW